MAAWVKGTRLDGSPVYINMDITWMISRGTVEGRTVSIIYSGRSNIIPKRSEREDGTTSIEHTPLPVLEYVIETPEYLIDRAGKGLIDSPPTEEVTPKKPKRAARGGG